MLTTSTNQPESQIRKLEEQLSLARREINNLRQQVRSLRFMQQKEFNEIKTKLDNWKCEKCSNDEAKIFPDNSCDPDLPKIQPIGIVTTDFPKKRGTPRQPVICPDAKAKLTLNNEVFTNPSHALEGLGEYSHFWILFHFHKNESVHVKAKVSPPRLNGIKTGVFATRSPHRPNPIGLSLVKLNQIIGNSIYFSGVDMIDKTPVLDIKPYIPHYDNPVMINLLQTETKSTFVTENALAAITVGDVEENCRQDVAAGVVSEIPQTDELMFSRSNLRVGLREAPDGQEEQSSSTSQSIGQENLSEPPCQIRVPAWINDSPVNTLSVSFKETALLQLSQLGTEGEEKKNIISNVLREDPRSIYLRERWKSHCYVFQISELYVFCKFNDALHSVTVYQVFQNIEPEED